jgi:hypothetical protein
MKKEFNNTINQSFCVENMKEAKPIMEQFNLYAKQELLCSIDIGDDVVPQGSLNFFNRHGYMIIKNLYDTSKFNGKNKRKNLNLSFDYEECQSTINIILQNVLDKRLLNCGYCEKIYFSNEEHIKNNMKCEYDLAVNLQISSNLEHSNPLFVKTLNGENIYVESQNGQGILWMNKKVNTWMNKIEEKYNKFEKFIKKFFMNKNSYYHHAIFYYNYHN